jgi:hypothetical protein
MTTTMVTTSTRTYPLLVKKIPTTTAARDTRRARGIIYSHIATRIDHGRDLAVIKRRIEAPQVPIV